MEEIGNWASHVDPGLYTNKKAILWAWIVFPVFESKPRQVWSSDKTIHSQVFQGLCQGFGIIDTFSLYVLFSQ